MPLNIPPSYGDEKEELWSYFLMDLQSMVQAILDLDWGSLNIIWILLRADWRNLWKNVESYAVAVGEAAEAWIDAQAANLWASVQIALDWLGVTWDSLGSEISGGWYTAVSWAEAKANAAMDWARARYDDARTWALNAWNWVRDSGPATWDWIRDKSWTVWAWINDKSAEVWDFVSLKGWIIWNWIQNSGLLIENWIWNRAAKIDSWLNTYMAFYQDLFDEHRDDLLDLLEEGIPGGIPKLLLSEIELWLYNRWFGEVS